MDGYEKLLSDISGIVEQMNGLRDIAFSQYTALVEDVIDDRITDIKAIERIMDGLCDFGDENRFIDLYPGPNHRMPQCCDAMYKMMAGDDEVLSAPPSGKGAYVMVRYYKRNHR